VSVMGREWEQRFKLLETEIKIMFEQEVLGAPVTVPTVTPMVEAVPVALAVPTVSVIRPIIATNTYQQVQQSLDARAAAAATVVTPIIPPPATFVGPALTPPHMRSRASGRVGRGAGYPGFVVPSPRPAPILRPTFVPHVLQRPVDFFFLFLIGPRPPPMRPPAPMVAPPIPGPPPMMMGPPMSGPPAPPMAPIGRMGPIPPGEKKEKMSISRDEVAVFVAVESLQNSAKLFSFSSSGVPVTPMVSVPRPMIQAAPKLNPTVIQAAPTVYSAPPVKKHEARIQKKNYDPPPPKKNTLRVEEVQEQLLIPEECGVRMYIHVCERERELNSLKSVVLVHIWADDFRIFCGDLGNEVNDDILARAFSRYPSFLKAKVIRDKRTGKTKGYGFVSFKDPNDYVRAMREMNGKYVGSRPIKLRKSMWKDRNIEVVRKKQKEKKKLGLR
uniref:RNA-binding protein 42 n=1 Tax=Latimeria chalumnae TaxID=7897 RepID=H2ZRU8_LATCH